MSHNAVLLFISALLFTTNLTSQIVIGRIKQPAQGALLELSNRDSSTDGANATKGLSLPRVELNNLKPKDNIEFAQSIGNTGSWNQDEHIGLLVYNIGGELKNICDQPTPEGLYVWTGVEWQGIGMKEVTETGSTDIYEGANSYIVKTGESISIPVKRAFDIWKDYASNQPGATVTNGKVLPPDYTNNFTNNMKGHIVWEEGMDASITSGVVSNVSVTGTGANAILKVTTGSNQGNALVQLQNASNETLWQWHIWVVNDDLTENIWSYASTGENPQCSRFMDRNLGALNVGDPSTTNTTTARPSHGLYFQWGRPTPMKTYGTYSKPNDAVNIQSSNQANLVAALSTHKFIHSDEYIVDWYEVSEYNTWHDRWGNRDINTETPKSGFDPCPEGWRVPSFKLDNSPIQGTEVWQKAAFWKPNAGKYLEYTDRSNAVGETNNPPILVSWQPAAGYRVPEDGTLDMVGTFGSLWAASPGSSPTEGIYNSFYLPLYRNYVYYKIATYRAHGYSVRCVKE